MNETEMFVCAKCGALVPADSLVRTAKGDLVCEDCLAENYAICDGCGEYFPLEDLTETGSGDLVCEDCLEANYGYCENCGEYHPLDRMNEVRTGWRERRMWCDDCCDSSAFYCDHCEEWYSDSYYECYESPDGGTLCEDCFGDLCCTCYDCGEVLWRDYAYWDDDLEEYLCGDCYNERRHNRVIHDYGYKPSAEFHTRKGVFTRIPSDVKDLFFGIEDECDKGDDANETAAEIQEITDALYIKHDGSLDCGFEMVTHPCTLAYHMYEMPWKHICKTARAHGFLSHDARTCGLHVHVGVAQMSDDPTEQNNIVGRIVLLVDRHWDALVKFSRRNESQLHWAERPHLPTYMMSESEYIYEALNTVRGGRYQAVNLTNRSRNNTIEFRLFNGTLKRDTIIATLQLLDNLCHYAMAHTTEEVLASKFADIVSVAEWKELSAYLVERGLTEVHDPAARAVDNTVTADLSVGDHVVVVNDNGGGISECVVGYTGTVVRYDPSAPRYAVAVRFDSDPYGWGHTCEGLCPNNDGYFFHRENLRLI